MSQLQGAEADNTNYEVTTKHKNPSLAQPAVKIGCKDSLEPDWTPLIS
jgi:hypothetical protein